MRVFRKSFARFFLVPAVLAAALAVADQPAAKAQADQAGIGLAPGTPAPDAQVEDLEGNVLSLRELVGDGPALIEFWASWCENCEALEPQMNEIHKRFAGQLTVVAVAVAVSQSRRRVRRHVERHSPEFTFVYDAQGDAVRAYQALTTSVVVLVDGQGRVALTDVGPDQDLIGAVEDLLKDPANN